MNEAIESGVSNIDMMLLFDIQGTIHAMDCSMTAFLGPEAIGKTLNNFFPHLNLATLVAKYSHGKVQYADGEDFFYTSTRLYDKSNFLSIPPLQKMTRNLFLHFT